jgi:hypothetical protein
MENPGTREYGNAGTMEYRVGSAARRIPLASFHHSIVPLFLQAPPPSPLALFPRLDDLSVFGLSRDSLPTRVFPPAPSTTPYSVVNLPYMYRCCMSRQFREYGLKCVVVPLDASRSPLCGDYCVRETLWRTRSMKNLR